MVNLKPWSTTIAEPKPKYGHLSKIDPAFAELKDTIDAQLKDVWNLPLDEFKTASKTAPLALPQGCPELGKEIDISDIHAEARDGTKLGIRIYKSKKTEPKNAVLYLKAHGGGFVVGGHGTEEAENRHVGALDDVVVVSVDYRMAPEFKYPYAVNDCFDVPQWSKANANALGIDPEKIVVGGGSAGSNIAAVLALMARDKKVTGIIGQVLNIPVTCYPEYFPTDQYEYGSWNQNQDASIINAPKMQWFWDQYISSGDAKDPYASPLLAKDLSGLLPALVQVAGLDPLRDEGFAYAEKLKAA
ncbi:lipase [Cadophora sp. DSE1049]|nr:lipase [Cadophora sp. DSE1049]